MWCIKFVTCNVSIYPHAIHIVCHLAHRRVCGAHMWCIKFVTRNTSMYPPALHITCHVAHRRFVQCGCSSATLVYYEPRTQTPHVCPTHSSVCQVADDIEFVRNIDISRATNSGTTCVPHTPQTKWHMIDILPTQTPHVYPTYTHIHQIPHVCHELFILASKCGLACALAFQI